MKRKSSGEFLALLVKNYRGPLDGLHHHYSANSCGHGSWFLAWREEWSSVWLEQPLHNV